MLPSFSVSLSAMDIDTKIRQNYVSQQPITMQLQEMEAKSNIKDLELPDFGVSLSQGNFLQDLLHIDPVLVHGSSPSNPVTGFQTANFVNPFDTFSFGCSSAAADFDVYESKPFTENMNGNRGYAHDNMENFQFGGNNYSLNVSNERNQMEMVDADLISSNCYLPFESQETTNKRMTFVVADDEVSIISADHSFLRRVDLNNKSRRLSSSSSIRRPCKVRNKSNVVKGQWTVEEDRLLIRLVERYGVRKWSHIAQSLPGRIGKQCRERWHNHLRPNIKKDTWSNEEYKILIEAHVEIGNKWAEIAKKLPGRTENSIKNHWNATKRRQYSRRKCRSKFPKPSLLQEYIKSLNLDKNPPIDYRKRSSSAANNNPNDGTRKASSSSATPPASVELFCPDDNDRLAPTLFDFNEVVPEDFCFDENTALFQEGCNLYSLLDDTPCPPDHTVHGGDFEVKLQNCSDFVFNNDGDDLVDGDDDQFGSGRSQNKEVQVKKEMEMMSQIKDVL